MKIVWFQTIKFKICLLLAIFAIVPLFVSGILFLDRMEDTLLADQKESVNTQLALVNKNLDTVFDGMFFDVQFYAEGELLQTIDSSITTYRNTTDSTLMRPGEGGAVERTIFASFEEFGKSHPDYQYIYMGTEQGGYIQYPDTYINAGYDPRQRPWYPIAKENPGQAVLGDPYYFIEDDIVIVGVSQTIQDANGRIKGVMAMDMSLDSLTVLFNDASRESKGYYMLLTQDGTILADPSNPSNNFLNLADAYGADFHRAVVEEADFMQLPIKDELFFVKSVLSEKTNWYYVSVIPQADLFQSVDRLQQSILAVLLLVLAVVLLAGLIASNSFSKPIKAVAKSAREVSQGDFDVQLQVRARGEVGLLVECFKKTGETLATYKNYIEEISAILNNIAEGNVAFALELDYMGEFSAIKQALLHISNTLTTTLSQIKSSSDQITASSEQLAEGSQVLGRGSTEQAAAVEQLTATVSEIAGQVTSNAEITQQANALSKIAVGSATAGNEQMQAVIRAMEEINDKAYEINNIMKIIDEIAFQTNILSLNAAVEAARAGSAGKGFAVVADEVRNLAQKTAKATQDTAVLIESSIQSVDRGTGIVGKTAQSLTGIMDNAQQLSSLLERIATASNQQSASIQQTVSGIEQISSVVRNNAAIAEQTAESSEELSQQAGLLNGLVSRFRFHTYPARKEQPQREYEH